MITLEKNIEDKAAPGKISIANVSRRNFLHGMLASSAFVLCARTSPLLAKAARNGAPTGWDGADIRSNINSKGGGQECLSYTS